MPAVRLPVFTPVNKEAAEPVGLIISHVYLYVSGVTRPPPTAAAVRTMEPGLPGPAHTSAVRSPEVPPAGVMATDTGSTISMNVVAVAVQPIGGVGLPPKRGTTTGVSVTRSVTAAVPVTVPAIKVEEPPVGEDILPREAGTVVSDQA